ncbi:hypothetical protein A33K_15359 [Burkholderia humptydooensis MSMB43]|uniref:Uncharacterized protein n=1 Tax=Burkholderia humptydooensis MSMB43 TaxID=441157 RepID=A0ABN0G561_9BURK|nr:hypothetical protein A33K_15359 [Burkholderia humptydooensis MSMB43]
MHRQAGLTSRMETDGPARAYSSGFYRDGCCRHCMPAQKNIEFTSELTDGNDSKSESVYF